MAEEIAGYHRNRVCMGLRSLTLAFFFALTAFSVLPSFHLCVSLIPNPIKLLGIPSGEQMGIPKLVLHFPPHPALHLSGSYTMTSKTSPSYQYIQFSTRLISSVKWGHKNFSLMSMLLRNNQNIPPLQNQFNVHDHFVSLFLPYYNF